MSTAVAMETSPNPSAPTTPSHSTPLKSSLASSTHRSPPSSHQFAAPQVGSASSSPTAATEAASPALRLPLRSPSIVDTPISTSASSSPAATFRPPKLNLSPGGSPSFSPAPAAPLKRLSSLQSTSSPSSNSSALSASSPTTHTNPPLSFRLRLSSLEVASPHTEPIVLGSPPASSHSASVPSPHTVFTSRIPRLQMPTDDDATASPTSTRTARPLIPALNLGLTSSPQSAALKPFRHALNITTLTSSDSPHAAASTNSPLLPLGNSSHDRAKRLAYYSKQCTAITDWLSVGGRAIASDLSILQAAGVTHIVNLVGDLCDNYFPDHFQYMRLFLLDHAGEDIICVLYPIIELVERCRLEGKRVLIHCQQGVSRSCVLCIAYIMYHMQMDYDAAFQYVRARRGICRPNVGFMAQLIAWQKRMTAAYHPLSLYRLAPHCTRDHTVVAKWVDRVDVSGLDDRGVFILHSHSCIYIWVGVNVGMALLELYYPEALRLVERLKRFEKATDTLVVLYQRDERLSHPQHHSVTSTSALQHDPMHSSTSSPTLSISATPASSNPPSPPSAAPTEPFFPPSYTPSQRFWALLGGGSPHNSHRNNSYDDYGIVMLSSLPPRPSSVPLPAMISARSASTPADFNGGPASHRTIDEGDERRGDHPPPLTDETHHHTLEREAQAAGAGVGPSASPLASPPHSQRGPVDFLRRRSYHKSIDAGSHSHEYLASADDHAYASIDVEGEDHPHGEGGDRVSRLPAAQSLSLSARVTRMSVSSHAQPSPPLGDGSEDAGEDEEMGEGGAVPNASLYSYPSFENLDHFDSDDLTPDGVFVLLRLGDDEGAEMGGGGGEGEGGAAGLRPAQLRLHVWFGREVEVREGFESLEGWAECIAIECVQQFPVLKREEEDNVKVVVERQENESEQWWEAFVEG